MKSDAEKEAGSIILKEYGHFFKRQFLEYRSLTCDEPWESNKTFVPIQAVMEPHEMVSLIDLVSSDNTLMTKVLSVLSSLCVEVIELKKEAYERHFPFLAVYEEYSGSDVSSQMEAICLLSGFVGRCEDVLRNICSQVFAIYTESVVNLNGIQLHYIINHIGEIFTILVLTELLIINTSLTNKWDKYCKEVKGQRPESVDLTEDRFKSILGAIDNIGSKLMNDNIVQNSLNNLSILRQKLVDKNTTTLANEMTQYLKSAIFNLDKLIQEKPSSVNLYKCIKINALFVLNTHLFGTHDKKIFKALLELDAKAHSVPVSGTCVWYPEQFLQRHLAAACASTPRLAHTMLRARQAYITGRKTSLPRDVANLQTLCIQWVLNVEDYFSPKHTQLNAAEMGTHAKALLSGLELASQTHYSLLTLINLHLSLGIPLSKSMLMSIFEIIDCLKCLKNAVNRNSSNIVTSINMIIQHLMFQATSSIVEVKKNLMMDKNFANQRLDELTCVVIAEKALKGAATTERIVAANVALSFIPDTTYEEDAYAKLGILLEKVQSLSNFMNSIEASCNGSWLIWHQNVIPIYLEQNFTQQMHSLKLKYFLSAIEDCITVLRQTDKQFNSNKAQEFLDSIKLLMEENVVKSTSQQIETNLRLHIHSHLQLDVVNPFMFEMTKKMLLVIDNFRLHQIYISVIPSVEHYLSTMYYNLTTVVLSDWKTYGEMRQMAKFKFNLNTVQDNLPTQTLEQGLDVLEIMRNIHIFVSKYHYNLNNQIFIEKSSNNKHLNSINIRHVANSIRTHGAGVMNTTVNFTYQFLKKKFFTFSQFLYDEHIKSRLIRDLRNFKEHSAANGNMYSFKNAEKFNKGIRGLGLDAEGQSYLALFRALVGDVGAALGYVRMVRAGGRHCCADATVFLPTLERNTSFTTLCQQNDLESSTLNAAEILDQNIDSLICNFTQGTEYFKLLVDVFAPIFRNPKNVHLKNFYMIVPPLTLNFVEHMILSKDKMTKKNKVGAAFTDDGFAMGVAYILKLLDQDSNFESLHWFESVWKHIGEERRSLEEQKSKGSVQLQQALALTEKKIKIMEQEFQLLYYSLTSARIFFR
ncbi:unnamed protein product [Plutella xylostella]|uniref:(diamondback moth) hypothetical protein n=1 Tax=Plutella xylostella TaxID=51655 RepID=A0A8S4EEE6_PLUXY|nr:unnamed protein product [Plutella xylostella]